MPARQTKPKPSSGAPRRLTRGRQRVAPLPPAAAAMGAVAVRVEPTRAATQACVVVGIPFPVNYWVIHALQAGTPAALYDAALFDQSVVAFAAYEAVQEKLSGSTVDAIKNKVVDSACGAQDGEFLISVTCAPTLASARKCAGIVLQNLRWGSLYQRYTNWCKAFGVRADKAAFSHAAAVANAATQRGVIAVFAGKVSATKDSAVRTADLLAKKVKDAPPKESGRARRIALADIELPEGQERFLEDNYRQHLAPGLQGVVVHNFVDSNVRGGPSHLVSGVLYVSARKDAQAKRLAATAGASGKAAKYAASLLRLGDEARGALVFIAAKGCYVGSAHLVVSGSLTVGSASGAIRTSLQ